MAAAYKIGQTVETSDGKQGLVKYVGPIHVAEGIWLGIELSTPDGKNDGAVRGERYFECPPGHGLFVKQASVGRIISQPPPSTPKAAAPKAKPAVAAAAKPRPSSVNERPASRPRPSSVEARTPVASVRPRPSSVVPAKPTARPSTLGVKRQSTAPILAAPSARPAARKASIAGSTPNTSESASRPTPGTARPSVASSTSSNNLRASRDSNVETLQTKIRHLEKQHTEAQERLRELVQIRDERDRFQGLIQKLQTKMQAQHTESQEIKERNKGLSDEFERLSRAQQEHEVDLEDALVDKEMAEERADQAEAEIESLRKRIEERDLELEILQEEAKMYTAEMSEEEKQEAGYYRLQHENERLRNALIMLKEITEEKEQDYKVTILGLEADASQVETYEREVSDLRERIATTEAIIEDLKQQLEAANEFEDMVSELSNQNQDFQDKIAQQDLAIQDLENLRELNDELEIQHLEQEEELRAELEVLETDLSEQTQRINHQETLLAEQETLISKFRDLVLDLQTRMADAESSKTMTEAQAKDTTGRFNEVMDLNRQLHAASIQSTTREIDAVLQSLKADQLSEQLEILYETGSKEFVKSESLQAYFTSKRITGKCKLLTSVLTSIVRQLSNGGRLEDALSRLVCSEAMSHLSILGSASNRLWSAMSTASLVHFANFGPTHVELVTIERTLDQGLESLKADTINFEEFSGALSRSIKIYEAVLASHQESVASHPEDEFLTKTASIEARLGYLASVYDIAAFALQKAPAPISETCEGVREHLIGPSDTTKGAVAAASKLGRTILGLRDDSMYPTLPEHFEDIGQQEESLTRTSQELTLFVRKLVDEILKYSGLSEAESVDAGEIEWIKTSVSDLDESQRTAFELSGISSLNTTLRQWIEHASVLMNSVEIEHSSAPWAQKAAEVEAERKKEDEAARQFQILTAEHRATLLKIHEREQVIQTKELEIEHLSARNRDVTAKVEEGSVLQKELDKQKEKITELQSQTRAQALELETLRERAAQFEQAEQIQPGTAITKNAAGVEVTEQAALPQAAPAGMKALMDALQKENTWLRQRSHTAAFDRSLKEVLSHPLSTHARERRASRTQPEETIDDILESIWLDDDEYDEQDSYVDSPDTTELSPSQDEIDLGYRLPRGEGVERYKFSVLELRPVRLDSRITWVEDEGGLLSVVQ